MRALLLPVLQSGYSVQYGNDVKSQQLDGGLPRLWRDFIGTPHSVSVQWTLDAGQYQYLMAFFRVWQADPQPFWTRLVIDDHQLLPYKTLFTPGGLQLASKNGGHYNVSGRLIVLPRAANPAFDAAILTMIDRQFNAAAFDALDELVNVQLPDALT